MNDRRTFHRSLLTAALAAGTVAAGVVGAPNAAATCASFFGIGNGNGCTSTLLSSAIAIGQGATANATGAFGAAVAVGTNAAALQGDAFTFGITVGKDSRAEGSGLFGIAINYANNGSAITQGSGRLGNLGLNIAYNSPGPTTLPTSATAIGFGNLASNAFGDGSNTAALGTVNIANNRFGRNNTVVSDNSSRPLLVPFTQNVAFSILGNGNTVASGPGKFATAGSILQTGATVSRATPGFTINTWAPGGASSAKPGASTPTVNARAGLARSLAPKAATSAKVGARG